MRQDDCIFCKIAGGDISSSTVYEDEICRVILDLGPAAKGHALVLPKDHYQDLFTIDDECLCHMMKVAKKVATAMKDALACDGLNIVQNNGVTAGQTVFHFHIHVIPRYLGDGQKIGWVPGEADPEEQAFLVEMIKSAL